MHSTFYRYAENRWPYDVLLRAPDSRCIDITVLDVLREHYDSFSTGKCSEIRPSRKEKEKKTGHNVIYRFVLFFFFSF